MALAAKVPWLETCSSHQRQIDPQLRKLNDHGSNRRAPTVDENLSLVATWLGWRWNTKFLIHQRDFISITARLGRDERYVRSNAPLSRLRHLLSPLLRSSGCQGCAAMSALTIIYSTNVPFSG